MANINLGPASTSNNNSAPSASFYIGSDRDLFERLLSSAGAVFNGISDDGPAIQTAINQYQSLNAGQLCNAIFPQNLTTYINSTNGATNQTVNAPNGACLTIPTSVAVDFNNCTMVSGPVAGASSCLILFTGDRSLPNSYGMMKQKYQNLQITGQNTYFGTDTIVIDNNTGVDVGPARISFKSIFFNGCGFGLVGMFNQNYLTNWQDCEFRGWNTGGRCFNMSSGTNQGENHSFQHCSFYNGGVAIRNVNSEASFYGCSFDYNVQHFDLTQSSGGRNNLYGCHLEGFTKQASYGATQYWVDMGATSTTAQFSMYGGQIYVATGTTGNTLAGIFNSGTGSPAAPAGVALYNVLRTLNSITLNNASATGRFLDTQ